MLLVLVFVFVLSSPVAVLPNGVFVYVLFTFGFGNPLHVFRNFVFNVGMSKLYFL